MANWRESLLLYLEPKIIAIFFLGFSSGLPLLLTFSTLSAWLTELGVERAQIGLFALVGLPYSFKFLWSPLVDHLQLPLIGRFVGRRKSWALFSQMLLIFSILGLGFSDPLRSPWMTAAFALLVAAFSATQDIVIDALRVELLPAHKQGAASAMAVLGYRVGMLVSGAGALYLAEVLPWHWVYPSIGGFLVIGAITVALLPEPAQPPRQERGLSERLKVAVLDPLRDFIQRKQWWLILIFIALFKIGDSLVGVMAMNFYLDLGFSKTEIASISKLFGLVATIVGGLVGGILVNRFSLFKVLLVTGLLQMLSNLAFAVQAMLGDALGMLTLTIAIENVASGMGTAAFVAFLSSLCSLRFTATQYALLSSLAALGRTMLSAPGGWLAERFDWVAFFVLTTALALPGLLLLYLLEKKGEGLGAGQAQGSD